MSEIFPRSRSSVFVIVILTCFIAAGRAEAETISFDLPLSPNRPAVGAECPSSASLVSPLVEFCITQFVTVVDGSSLSGRYSIEFYPVDPSFPTTSGGLDIITPGGTSFLVTLFGPKLYTGSESMPTFLPGNYFLTSGTVDAPFTLTFAKDFNLSITGDSELHFLLAGQPVPEPSSLFLLGTGLLAVVSVLRWQRRR